MSIADLEARLGKLEQEVAAQKMDQATACSLYEAWQADGGIRMQIQSMQFTVEEVSGRIEQWFRELDTLRERHELYMQRMEANLNRSYELERRFDEQAQRASARFNDDFNREVSTLREKVAASFDGLKQEIVTQVAKTLAGLQRGGILVVRPAHPFECKEGLALPTRQVSAEETRQGFAHGFEPSK
jgi:hypothetical protein